MEPCRRNSGAAAFHNGASGSQLNALGGSQSNNLGNGPQFIASHFHSDVIIRRSQEDVERENTILRKFYKSSYLDQKDQNPAIVEGTCEWFESHSVFKAWRDDETFKVLWVSADPGCGKSVLAKRLIDSVLPTTRERTVCYFFFKDDFADQRDVASALLSILHQLFTTKRVLLSKCLGQLQSKGDELLSSPSELWRILTNAAEHEEAGEIVCIIDALDECDGRGRSFLTKSLDTLYATENRAKLKFLITSRPYESVQNQFHPRERSRTIHLAGEGKQESEKISQDIGLFIKAGVKDIAFRKNLTHDEHNLLLDKVLEKEHRTYLWAHLILRLIENDNDINGNRIVEITSHLPETVYAAYEKILSKSTNRDKAKKLLHIVVAAKRPLTVQEMALALTIEERHKSYHSMDVDPPDRFCTKIREFCGLFVNIIDSRVYLLHQTAREFLITESPPQPGHGWRHSLHLQTSHRVLVEACIRYISLAEVQRFGVGGGKSAAGTASGDGPHAFFGYFSQHWAAHARDLSREHQGNLVHQILAICNPSLSFFPVWFESMWEETYTEMSEVKPPAGITTLMTASLLGLASCVEHSRQNGCAELNNRDATYKRTALCWAVLYGFADVVETLLQRNKSLMRFVLPSHYTANVNLADCHGRTPLSYAVWSKNVKIVELLLRAGANVNKKDSIGGTPLDYAGCTRHTDIIRLFGRRSRLLGDGRSFRDVFLSAVRRGDIQTTHMLHFRNLVGAEDRMNLERRRRFSHSRQPLCIYGDRTGKEEIN